MSGINTGDPDLSKTDLQERGKCASCAEYPKCLFHMPRYGGFKGQGVRYVRYRLITDRVERANGKEDFCTCVTFVGGGLQDRMLSGNIARDSGRKGAELVSLIVDERNTVTQGMEMGFNSRGEIIKPQLNLVEDLKRAGHKVNVDDYSMPVRFDIVEFERTVPDYNDPKVTSSSYSSKMAQREAERERDEEAAEAEVWNNRGRMKPVDPDDWGETTVEPMRKGPGRPRKNPLSESVTGKDDDGA